MTLQMNDIAPDFEAQTTQGTSVSISGWVIPGACYSRTRRTSPRSVPRNWVTWPAWRTSLQSGTARSWASASIRLSTTAGGRKISRSRRDIK